MNLQKTTIRIFAILIAGIVFISVNAGIGRKVDDKQIAQLFAQKLPQLHLKNTALDNTVATNALNSLLNSLDYSHAYFLASDVKKLRQHATELDDDLKAGDLSFAKHIYTIFLNRVSNRTAYVSELLNGDFDLEKEELYNWKRKDAPWPADTNAWNRLWRKRIKNEYVARLVNDKIAMATKDAKSGGTNSLGLALATNSIPTTNSPTNLASNNQNSAQTEGFGEELDPKEFIRNKYEQYQIVLEDNESDWLLERFLNAFATTYDPHTTYMSPSTSEDFDISMKLSLVGIGALLRSEDGMARVVRLIPGGPAEQDGRLSPGDKIIAVAQGKEKPVSILHWPLSKAVQIIRGEKGTRVILTIIPAEDKTETQTERIALTRDQVKLKQQQAKSEIRIVGEKQRKIGIITLPAFYIDIDGQQKNPTQARSSARDVREALNSLKTNQVEGIILDLRNNGGGSLEEAIDIAGQFITSGPIVQVKQNHWGVRVLSDPDPIQVYKGPLIILVNRLSASASEIVSAALKDYGRAVVIGDSKTHGKGTVQTLIPLDRGDENAGSLKVTTAGFYRISGKSTQLNGIEPHIVIPSALDEMDLGEDQLPHAIEAKKIAPAFYMKENTLKNLISVLEEKSKTRLAKNQKYQKHIQKLLDYRKQSQTGEISLSLSNRVERSLNQIDLERIEQNFLEEESAENKKNDLQLEEALRIMDDMAGILNPKDSRPAKIAG